MTTLNNKTDPWKAFSGSRAKGALAQILCLQDFEHLAQKRLPRPIFGYVAGAAERNQSLHDNSAAFDAYSFVPRVLRDVSQRHLGCELFGVKYGLPLGIAPMGVAALSCYQGDVAMARAAQDAGIPYVLSGTGLTPLETIAQAAPASWFQAYLPGTQERIDALIDRAARAGYKTLVITVDVAVAGNRENNLRAGFSTPLRPNLRLAWDGIARPRWLLGTFLRTLLDGMPHFENSFAERGAPIISSTVDRDFSQRDHLNWTHLAAIRQRWQGNLVVKGILSPQDARQAKDLGVDAMIVSNHGGRQLDGAVAPLQILPQVLEAVGDLPVMLDGGVRRGSDVLKALALGARMVFVGRPFNYAAACGAQTGVAHAIDLLRAEIDRNMAMLGVTELAQLDSTYLLKK
jgi:L-lactate dehydrogenase (cytochrome)